MPIRYAGSLEPKSVDPGRHGIFGTSQPTTHPVRVDYKLLSSDN